MEGFLSALFSDISWTNPKANELNKNKYRSIGNELYRAFHEFIWPIIDGGPKLCASDLGHNWLSLIVKLPVC